ncbi:MAG: adenine deaminase [Deltaproteobacteria bacterium]|nr:adenine deaminase [Deltaproteobacteria bacterium]
MLFRRDTRKLVETALGNRPADIVIKDGLLLDVYTGRLLSRRSIAISGQWIAYVGPDAEHTIGKNTEVIQARGRVLCPGYMDAHTHVAVYWDIADFLSYVVPCGVTTIFTETEAYGFVAGARGFRAFMDQVRDRPIKIFGLIPPMVCLSPAMEPLCISPEETRELLNDPWVMGLGEPFWQGVIQTREDRVPNLIQETLGAGKSVQGHAAGAFDRKLAAYSATGVQSCHEAITTDDVISRLEMGLYAMIREGDIRRDLEIILPLKDQIDLRRIILVTDGTNPGDLMTRGYLIDVVQKAMDMGFSPVEAVQMVTLNPAEHFGLDHLMGGIAPGRLADILILPEPGTVRPELVISNGRIIAEHGRTTVEMEKRPYPHHLLKTVRVNPVSPVDLAVSAENGEGAGQIRIMEIQPGGLVAREERAVPKVVDHRYVADPERDLLKIVFIERISGRGERFIGFIRGWGQKKGAVATTLCWDTGGMVAIGANDHDLASAINRVIELDGGTVLFVEGAPVVEIPLSVTGFISRLSIPELATRLAAFQKEVSSLGSTLPFAHLGLNVLTTAAIPFIRMNETGYYRFREGDVVTLGPP